MIFSFGLVAEWHKMVGKILVQTKLNEMSESLGEEKKKQRQLTAVSIIFLLSLVSCFAFGFKTFLVIYLGLIGNKNLFQHKMLSLGKWQLFISKSPRMLYTMEGVNLLSI